MEVQIERLSAGMVDAGANVIFDSTLVVSPGISYDETTGVLTIQELGRYEFDWWVATQTSLSTNGMGFAVTSSQGDIIVGNSPIKTGEVVGVAILDVMTVPIEVELKNNSNQAIYYAQTVPVKASLAVITLVGSAPVAQMAYIAATGRPTQTSFLPGEGLLYDSIAQAGTALIMTDEAGGYTLFSATVDGVYEFSFGVQIANVYAGTATFYFDLRAQDATLLNRIEQSVTGPSATVYFSAVLTLQVGEGVYMRFSGANGNDTQGAGLTRTVTIKQLEAL